MAVPAIVATSTDKRYIRRSGEPAWSWTCVTCGCVVSDTARTLHTDDHRKRTGFGT